MKASIYRPRWHHGSQPWWTLAHDTTDLSVVAACVAAPMDSIIHYPDEANRRPGSPAENCTGRVRQKRIDLVNGEVVLCVEDTDRGMEEAWGDSSQQPGIAPCGVCPGEPQKTVPEVFVASPDNVPISAVAAEDIKRGEFVGFKESK